jgi:hypothetical protein
MKRKNMHHIRIGTKLITFTVTTESGVFESAKVSVVEYFPQYRVVLFDSVTSDLLEQHDFDDRKSALRFLDSEMRYHAGREHLVDGHLLEYTDYTPHSYETYVEYVPVFRIRKIKK